jgi:hypothetical protein
MITNLNRKPTLEEVLAELASLAVPPSGADFRAWIERYPEFKAEIIDFVTDWVDMEVVGPAHESTEEEVDLIVNRTMSRVQQILDDAEQQHPIIDLLAEIKAAGQDFDSFQRQIGIDRSLLTCLADRMIRPSTIPLRLVTAVAGALNRTLDAVRDYFRLPMLQSATYKSRKAPNPTQQDFARLIECSGLSADQRDFWLNEAPDPDLRA